MSTHHGKTVFQVLVEAAVTLWTSHQGIKALRGTDVEGSMKWWDTVRRLASWAALRFGLIALHAEHRYDMLKVA